VTIPVTVPALVLIAGTALGVLAPDWRGAALAAAGFGWMCALAAWARPWPQAVAPAALLAFGAVGIVMGGASAAAAVRTPLARWVAERQTTADAMGSPVLVEGRLRADAIPAEYGASLLIDVQRIEADGGWRHATGGARLAVSGSLAAAALHEWRAGRTVRLPAAALREATIYRNPGVSDGRLSLARRGVAVVGSVKSAALVEVIARGHPFAEAAGAVRAWSRETIGRALPDRPVAAAIVTAILIGDRGGLTPELDRRLQEAGTYHVIAISGGNIAILAGLLYLLLRAARVPSRARAVLLAALLCAYGYVAGGGPSVGRATLAAVVYLLARAADHRTPSLNVLALVALSAVVYAPLDVFDPGLALSYGATLALLIGGERVLRRRGSGHAEGRRGGTLPGRLGASALSASLALLVATLCAEAALFPVGAFVFHRITIAGLLLNFAAIPLMTAAQIGGLATLALTPAIEPAGRWAGWVAGHAADGLVWSARLVDAAPWLAWRVPAPALRVMAVYYGAWAVRLAAPRRPTLRRGATVVLALAAVWIATPVALPIPGGAASRQLRVTFLDVGQGDAVLIQFPGGRAMLVDTAGLPGSSFDLGERVVLPALLAAGVRRLEYLAITHGDPDHLGGAMTIARDLAPREIWEGVVVPPHAPLRDLRALGAARGAVSRSARVDDRVTIGGAELHVLHPPEPDWERQRVRNDDSLVFEVRYGDVSIVLPGDIGADVERAIAPRLSDAPLRVLKASHHGSASSSAPAWLAAARPAAVVFSCGRHNRFGHPHPAVLARVRATGAAIFRTDDDGAITVTTDGQRIRIESFTGRRVVLPDDNHSRRPR
jgi:competence protein ComEC